MSTLNSYQTSPVIQKKKWWIIGTVSYSAFVAMLGASIVSIAVPEISHDLHISTDWAEKLVSLFLLVLAVCSLLFGKLADRYGKKKIFSLGMIVITLGALLSGIPLSFPFLIFSRCLQAVGAAMVLSNNNAIVTEIALPQQRGQALGVLGAFSVVGGVIGPSIGGLIINILDWPFLFLLMIPLGLIGIFLNYKFLPKDCYFTNEKIDYLGFAIIFTAFFVMYGAILVGQFRSFADPLVWGLFSIFIIILLLFLLREKKCSFPLVRFGMFRNKTFLAGLATAFLIYGSSYFYTVPMPIYLQDVLGFSAGYASLLFLVFPIVMAIMSPISGILVDKYSGNVLIILGLIVLAVSQLFFLLENLHSSIWLFVINSILMGLGMSLFQIPNNTMIMSVGTSQNLGTVSSLKSCAQNSGRFLGISFSTTILYAAMSRDVGHRVTSFVSGRPELFLYGMRVTFIVSFVLCLLSLIFVIVKNQLEKRSAVK